MTAPVPGTPDRLGRYRVLGGLDPEPGFRTLLAAAPDDSLLVIKQAQPSLLELPDFRITLRHNAVSAMRVDGAGNVTVVDVDTDAELPWLAHAFVPGVRLDRVVAAHGPLPAGAVRRLAAELARALRGVHSAGLLHQRLRADTIALTRDGILLAEGGFTFGASNAPLGSPEFLAPEQSWNAQISTATDVFALGSVLAFAASGTTPFLAPSVPYTLFNIAQREPDLRAVPESLRELISACLRKDPRARPTPGQILEYVGNQFEAWPDDVLADIDRRRAEVAALVAAAPPLVESVAEPAVTTPRERLSNAARVVADASRRAVATGRTRFSAMSTNARRASAIGAVALLVATGSTSYLLWRGEPEAVAAAPTTGLTLDQLRRTDACAWLEAAIGESVPTTPVPVAKDGWKLRSVTGLWGCVASAGRPGEADYHYIRLDLGQHLKYFTPQTTMVGDVPVLIGAEPGCGRGIASPGVESSVGIVLSYIPNDRKNNCKPAADHIIGAIARTLDTAPRLDLDPRSLALLDPCRYLDRDKVAAEIGPVAATPAVSDAHTCVWEGTVSLTVQLLESSLITSDNLLTTEINGLRVYGQNSVGSICTVAYRIPDTAEEAVEVQIQGATGTSGYCPSAVSLLEQVVTALQKR